jgi:hypothetical protein
VGMNPFQPHQAEGEDAKSSNQSDVAEMMSFPLLLELGCFMTL